MLVASWRHTASICSGRCGTAPRAVGSSVPTPTSSHPLLASLARITAATTYKQGIGGIERGKLTNGDHFWLKRRDGLGTPVEFEVWDGATTRAIARKDRPWEPDHFERWTRDGRKQEVAPEDAIWFRH